MFKRIGKLIVKLGLLGVAAGLLMAAGWALLPAEQIARGESDYLDMHVHVAGIGAGNSGAFVNDKMRDNFRFRFYLQAMGVTLEEIEREGDQLVIRRLSQSLGESTRVGKAVVLALDGVVDPETGELDRALTQVYVPGEYLATETAKYYNLLFGASINPYRNDALQRLERANADGAVLVKWIPAIMHINPADPALVPFYQKMVELDLPLLSHAGQERSFAHAADEYSDPMRLELPLKTGVTVIAAHIATTGEYEGQSSFERILPMFAKYPNLYSEISSLTQINKLGYLARTLEIEDIESRLLYGTDWPLTVIPLMAHPAYQVRHISFGQAKAITQLDNPWDRDVALKQAIGVPEAVFNRGAELLLRNRDGQ